MNPVLASITIGLITTLAKWAKGKQLDVETIVGITVLAIILSIISTANDKLGRSFALLSVVAVSLAHAHTLFDSVTKGKGSGGSSGGGGNRRTIAP